MTKLTMEQAAMLKFVEDHKDTIKYEDAHSIVSNVLTDMTKNNDELDERVIDGKVIIGHPDALDELEQGKRKLPSARSTEIIVKNIAEQVRKDLLDMSCPKRRAECEAAGFTFNLDHLLDIKINYNEIAKIAVEHSPALAEFTGTEESGLSTFSTAVTVMASKMDMSRDEMLEALDNNDGYFKAHVERLKEAVEKEIKRKGN